MLVILILVVPVVAEKKVDAMAQAVVPAMMCTLLVVLIAYGISIYDHEAAVEICNDFWNKISDKSKEAIKHYDDEGEITYNSILDREARMYVQNMKSELDIPGGVYTIDVLSGLEVQLHNQGQMVVSEASYSYVNMINTSYWASNDTYIVIINFGKYTVPIISYRKGTSGRAMMRYQGSEDAYYMGYYDHNWDMQYFFSLGKGRHLMSDLDVKLLKVYDSGVNKVYISAYGDTYRAYMNSNWSLYVGGLRENNHPNTNINYYVYKVLNDEVLVHDDVSTWDLPFDVVSDHVEFGDAVEEGNLDLIIQIPELTDTNDLLGMQLGDLTKITSKTEGLYGLLSRVWQTIKTIARTLSITLVEILQNIYTAITSLSMTSVFEFTVGNTADIVTPNVSLDLVTTRFPFSIPWDLKNIITGLVYTGDLPEFSLKLPSGTFGDKSFTVKIPQQFRFGITFVRTALVIIFIIGLVYTTRRLLGGAV